MVTSCEVYLADLNTVEPSPTSSVLSAILRMNCGVGLLCSLPEKQVISTVNQFALGSSRTKARPRLYDTPKAKQTRKGT